MAQEPNNAIRVLGYGRQSQGRPGEDATSSLSLNGQSDLFRAECDKRGWVSLGFVTDHDLKGDDPNRPGIHQLLERVKSGGVDGVWVTMLNRFSNDYIWQGLTWRNLKSLGVQYLISYVEGPVEDEFILGIHGLVSGKRITELKVHLRNAFARRARDGAFPVGAAPFGYRRPHSLSVVRPNGTAYERQTGVPFVVPEEAEVVREVFERAASGESFFKIASALDGRIPTQRGGLWGERHIGKMLSNTIYAGDISHHGEVVAHNDDWQIVDTELWQRVQRQTGTRVVVRNGADHWLEGLVHHACGHRMYFHERPNKNSTGVRGLYACKFSKMVPSAACNIAHGTIVTNILDPVVIQCLTQDLATVTPSDEALRIAQELSGGEQARKTMAALEKRLATAEARWARNHERFSDGKLSSEIMDKEDARLATERDAVNAERATLPPAPDPIAIKATARLLASLADQIPAMSPNELRPIVQDLGNAVVDVHEIRMDYATIDPYGIFIRPQGVPIGRWGRRRRL